MHSFPLVERFRRKTNKCQKNMNKDKTGRKKKPKKLRGITAKWNFTTFFILMNCKIAENGNCGHFHFYINELYRYVLFWEFMCCSCHCCHSLLLDIFLMLLNVTVLWRLVTSALDLLHIVLLKCLVGSRSRTLIVQCGHGSVREQGLFAYFVESGNTSGRTDGTHSN